MIFRPDSLLTGWLLFAWALAPPAFAQQDVVRMQAYSAQQLEQMLAPVALYPDGLLWHILMASTHPVEVVEAARWSRAHPDARGGDALGDIQEMDWDASVKSLVAFPLVLQMMDEKLDWTASLGQAFRAEQAPLMDAVQRLRRKAYETGRLVSDERIRVQQEGAVIVIAQANPEAIYVPYYDPASVYGVWPWPAYPPMYWAPWPDYRGDAFFSWGRAIMVPPGFFFGSWDWRRHRLHVEGEHRNVRPQQGSSPGQGDMDEGDMDEARRTREGGLRWPWPGSGDGQAIAPVRRAVVNPMGEIVHPATDVNGTLIHPMGVSGLHSEPALVPRPAEHLREGEDKVGKPEGHKPRGALIDEKDLRRR